MLVEKWFSFWILTSGTFWSSLCPRWKRSSFLVNFNKTLWNASTRCSNSKRSSLSILTTVHCVSHNKKIWKSLRNRRNYRNSDINIFFLFFTLTFLTLQKNHNTNLARNLKFWIYVPGPQTFCWNLMKSRTLEPCLWNPCTL